ncbi:MAG: chaperonin GroEL [Clostridiales bacterium]|nr:chaperonin GroEL [Clostridiales bacterium]
MAKDLFYSMEIKKKMIDGCAKAAEAVKATMGPVGRNVLMYQKANLRDAKYSDAPGKDTPTMVINDGVTILKSILLPDPAENMGVELMRNAAEKTNDAAGDGTSTTVLLVQTILQEGYRHLAAGAHPLLLRKGLHAACDLAVSELEHMAKPVSSGNDISMVATVSCQDEKVGQMIGKALQTIGLEGVIQIDDSGRPTTTMEILEGIVFDRGFFSPLMATDEMQTMAELHNPYILITDTKFENSQDLIPILIQIAETGRGCLIICDSLEGDAMGLILKNKMEGDMDIVCVPALLYGEGRQWRMEDMAVQTGASYISKDFGIDIRKATLEMLGTAEYVKVTRHQTVITGAGGDPAAVENRVRELRYLVNHTEYDFNRERYQERLAKFVSGVAKIDIGGTTEAEIRELRFRAEDAVVAVRAALESGIVPGGGSAYLGVLPALQKLAERRERDVKTGIQVLMRALEMPARQILRNAGLDDGEMLGSLKKSAPAVGYNVADGQYTDMYAAGIIDPLKVSKTALQSAVSAASTILTAEAGTVAITDKKHLTLYHNTSWLLTQITELSVSDEE